MLFWEAMWFGFLTGLLVLFTVGALIDHELRYRRMQRQRLEHPAERQHDAEPRRAA